MEEAEAIEIPENDIRVDVFRSSGPGGQSVNTTDSAVRITHLPTGTVVSMQNEKSQIQNRAAAMRVLQSRLLILQKEQEAATKKELAGTITASWGDQMRSYVLAPYQMVKDLRTDYEVEQPRRRVRRRPRRIHRRRHPLAQVRQGLASAVRGSTRLGVAPAGIELRPVVRDSRTSSRSRTGRRIARGTRRRSTVARSSAS